MNVFAYDVQWKKDDRLAAEHEYGSPRVFPFGGSNDQPDHSRLNIEYFKRLDRVIDYLDRKGIAAHLMHRGPYATEAPTIEKLHAFIAETGHRLRGLHHEIYLTDPRRVDPERNRTIIRQPIG